ncbi:uncharacterized protein LOC131948101 [Physella acuta]|uniref:uncharacterized protein LOC131948101 n=1 Tax=Physella acuta TaxID=109671 RepID=UPI0027DB5773|nr:uncharacterized protein LOC131948101 [Physella acuta]
MAEPATPVSEAPPESVTATPSSQNAGSPTVQGTPSSQKADDSVFQDDTEAPPAGFSTSTPRQSKTKSLTGCPTTPITPASRGRTPRIRRARTFSSSPRMFSVDTSTGTGTGSGSGEWSWGSEFSEVDETDHAYHTMVDPVTGMTEEEKEILLKSWYTLVGVTPEEFFRKGEQFGLDFLHWMFDNVPNMKKTFKHKFDPFRPKPALSADPEFQKHCKTLVTWLESMMVMLFEPTKFEQQVVYIANMHLAFPEKIGMAYWGPLNEKFPQFIGTALAKRVNDREVQLWSRFLGLIVARVKKSEQYNSNDKCCSLQ